MESAARGHVARADARCPHRTHAAQQKPCRRRGPAHLAAAGGAENRVRDEKNESRAFGRIVCAWPGEECGKLSGREIRTWAGDTSCAVLVGLPQRGGACWARRGSPGSRAHLLALGSRALQVPEKRCRHVSRVGIDPTSAPKAASGGLQWVPTAPTSPRGWASPIAAPGGRARSGKVGPHQRNAVLVPSRSEQRCAARDANNVPCRAIRRKFRICASLCAVLCLLCLGG